MLIGANMGANISLKKLIRYGAIFQVQSPKSKGAVLLDYRNSDYPSSHKLEMRVGGQAVFYHLKVKSSRLVGVGLTTTIPTRHTQNGQNTLHKNDP